MLYLILLQVKLLCKAKLSLLRCRRSAPKCNIENKKASEMNLIPFKKNKDNIEIFLNKSYEAKAKNLFLV